MTRSLAQAMDAFRPGLPLAVAYSGGADSTALLLACAEKWPGQISAIHIHHGLQAAADGFEQHCRATCARLGVPLQVLRVDARPGPGSTWALSRRRLQGRPSYWAALRPRPLALAWPWLLGTLRYCPGTDKRRIRKTN